MWSKQQRPYTQGQLNVIIDSICHPLAARNPFILVLDTSLHVLVERDLSKSTVKFIKYNAPKIIEQLIKERNH